MLGGLTAHHVPTQLATQLSHLPPTGYLFAAFLGYNPLQQLLGPHVLAALSAADAHTLVSKQFFPSLIGGPFKDGIVYVLIFAAAMCFIAALASVLRGGKFVHDEAHTSHGQEHGRPQGRSSKRADARTPDPDSGAAWSRASRGEEQRPLDL
jgi:hypothetical protein